MTRVSRRGLFGLFAGAAALPVLAKLPGFPAASAPEVSVPVMTGTMAELIAITRKAFLPKLVVQIYSSSPMLLMMNAERDRVIADRISVPTPIKSFNWNGYDR